MIIARNGVNTIQVRLLCSEVTTTMEDRSEAERLAGFNMGEVEALAFGRELDQQAEIIRSFLNDALEAANRMIKAALG